MAILNDKEISILERISNNKRYTIGKLSDEYKISTRSVRYYIENINMILKILKKGKIEVRNSNLILNSDIDLDELLILLKENMILNKKMRKNIIELILLFDKNGLNILKLSEELKVSRATIKNDFNEIQSSNLSKIYRVGKGYVFKGDARDILVSRIELLEEIFLEIEKTRNILTRNTVMKYLVSYINMDYFHNVQKFLKILTKEFNLKNIDYIYSKLEIYFLLLIYYSNEQEEISLNIMNDKERYRYLKKIYLNIFKETESKNNLENKILKINEIITGLSIENIGNDIFFNWIDINFIIKKMIMRISNILNEDLTKDDLLFDYLVYHIKPCIYRMKNNIEIDEELYMNLVEIEQEVIESVKISAEEIEEIFEFKFSEIEIMLLAYHIKAAIMRNNFVLNKKIILVCKLGYGTSKILEANLKNRYNVDVIKIIGEYEIEESLKGEIGIDAILTTIDLKINVGIPIIKITPNLTEEDVSKMQKIGITINQKKIPLSRLMDIIRKNCVEINEEKILKELKGEFSEILYEDYKKEEFPNLKREIQKENFLIIEDEIYWEEAIRKMGELLEINTIATKKYTDEIINTINKVGPYFVLENGIAVPHGGFMDEIKRSGVVLIIFKNEIKFENNKKASIFLGIASKDKEYYSEILNEILVLSNKINIMENIDRIQDYKDWKTFIISI